MLTTTPRDSRPSWRSIRAGRCTSTICATCNATGAKHYHELLPDRNGVLSTTRHPAASGRNALAPPRPRFLSRRLGEMAVDRRTADAELGEARGRTRDRAVDLKEQAPPQRSRCRSPGPARRDRPRWSAGAWRARSGAPADRPSRWSWVTTSWSPARLAERGGPSAPVVSGLPARAPASRCRARTREVGDDKRNSPGSRAPCRADREQSWVVCYEHHEQPLSDHLTASKAQASAQRRARTEGIARGLLHDCYTRVHTVSPSA